MAKPYGYLLLDLHQLTPDNMQLRTNILPGKKQIVMLNIVLKQQFQLKTSYLQHVQAHVKQSCLSTSSG